MSDVAEPRRIRVLHLVYRLTVGGAENVMMQVIRQSQREIAHTICALTYADEYQRVVPEECRVFELHKKDGNDVRLIGRIRDIILAQRIDVVHGWGWPTYLEGLLATRFAFRSVRYIFAFRGKTYSEATGFSAVRRIVESILGRFVNGIVTPCNQMRLDYSRTFFVPSSRITVIGNGVDVPRFSRARGSRDSIRESMGYKADKFVIGTVARVDAVKNIPLLVEAFALVAERFPETQLMIVGSGADEQRVLAEIKSQGVGERVAMVGRSTDVPRVFAAMDLFVLPSLYEGFSNTLLEAMAAEVPIVATDVGGNSEVLENGRAGLLVPSGHKGMLADAIGRVITDSHLRESLVATAMRRVTSEFTLDHMVDAYVELYKRSCGEVQGDVLPHSARKGVEVHAE